MSSSAHWQSSSSTTAGRPAAPSASSRRGQRLEAAGLAERLGAGLARPASQPEHVGEPGQGGADRLARSRRPPRAPRRSPRARRRPPSAIASATPAEHLERAGRGLVDALAAQHPGAAPGRAPAARRAGASCRRPTRPRAAPGARPPCAARSSCASSASSSLVAADEGRLGERPALVVQADHEARLAHAARAGPSAISVEVRQRGLRGLVAVARVLAQAGAGPPRRAPAARPRPSCRRSGGRAVRCMPQQLADALGLERRAARQALEEQDADRVEVRALVDVVVEQPRLLRARCSGPCRPSAAAPPASSRRCGRGRSRSASRVSIGECSSTITLPGFTSRCRTPWSCASCSASRMRAPTVSASGTDSRPRAQALAAG